MEVGTLMGVAGHGTALGHEGPTAVRRLVILRAVKGSSGGISGGSSESPRGIGQGSGHVRRGLGERDA